MPKSHPPNVEHSAAAPTEAIDQLNTDDNVALAIKFAMLAPSPRNIQPWAFSRPHDGEIDLYFDRSRSRPVADPYGRELIISCGVALRFLRLALKSLGTDHVVNIYPEPHNPDLVAKIRLTDEVVEPDGRARDLVAVALARHTNWHTFIDERLPRTSISKLRSAAQLDGMRVTVVSDADRPMVEYLAATANHRQLANPKFVAELKRWPVGRPEDHNPPFSIISTETESAKSTGELIALATIGDTEEQWLVTGQGLADLLLTATGLGLAIAFMNQPVQAPQSRRELSQVLLLNADLQQLIRVGTATEDAGATPRRSFEDVLAPLSEPW